MIWGKAFNPRNHLTPPMQSTFGQPKPEIIPADISGAIATLVQAAGSEGFALAVGGRERGVIARDYAAQRRKNLEAVILKHLRGEA